nr:unnamed protein product [Callosobruchus chinensis]CAH7724478.1 unnamed protein product [Callosobruchus chinensis]
MAAANEGQKITIDQVYDLVKSVLLSNKDIQQEIKENKVAITQEIKQLQKDFTTKFEDLKRENEELKRENDELKNKMSRIERTTRKYNIVVYGLKEEDIKNDFEQIINIINNKLNVRCIAADFRDCYRIGAKATGKIRPLCIECIHYNIKTDILSRSKQLKASGLHISNHYTPSEYEDRKLLYTSLKQARDLNLEAKIEKNILRVANLEFTVETLKNITPSTLKEALLTQGKSINLTQEETTGAQQQEVNLQEKVDERSNSNTKSITLEEVEKWIGSKRKQPWNIEGSKPKRSARINSSKTELD